MVGRRAVVTGGAGGIGKAISRALAAEGAKVAVVDLAESAAQESAAEVGATIGVGCDVTDRFSVAAVAEAGLAGQIEVIEGRRKKAGRDLCVLEKNGEVRIGMNTTA